MVEDSDASGSTGAVFEKHGARARHTSTR